MGWIKKINWTLTLFLLLTPVVGVAGTVFIVASGRLHIATIVLALVWMVSDRFSYNRGLSPLIFTLYLPGKVAGAPVRAVIWRGRLSGQCSGMVY